MISFFAKKARGEMAAFIIKNKIKSPEELIKFDVNGYSFFSSESDETTLVFKREQSQ